MSLNLPSFNVFPTYPTYSLYLFLLFLAFIWVGWLGGVVEIILYLHPPLVARFCSLFLLEIATCVFSLPRFDVNSIFILLSKEGWGQNINSIYLLLTWCWVVYICILFCFCFSLIQHYYFMLSVFIYLFLCISFLFASYTPST